MLIAQDTSAAAEPLTRIATKLMWWMKPEDALSCPTRFAAQVMTLGNWEDVVIVRDLLGNEVFRKTLREAPAGVFDAASWLYWHHVYNISPIPELPKRQFS